MVCRLDWVLKQENALLQDAVTYTQVTDGEALKTIMQDSKEFVTENIWLDYGTPTQRLQDSYRLLSKQECDFIAEGVELNENLPRFYAIPKIHKDPWRLRPIVPCHFWYITNVAKVVQQQLSPLMGRFLWIIHSTKAIAQTLSTVAIPVPCLPVRTGRPQRLYICSRDVRAMYTNITMTGVMQALETFIRDKGERELAIHLVHLILDSSFFQHQHRVFKQIGGLTMGAACSPTLGNLVGAFHEFSGPTLQVRNDPNVLWYRRYLDDISIGVMASSKVEAEARIQDVTLGPDQQLTWDIKEEGEGPSPFLDLDIYVLPESPRVDFKLFRKPMNHFHRVSWDSAHPYGVKRARFLGELTRMARCSSTYENYQAATAEYREILLARGYPPGLLHSWVHTEMNRQWATRNNAAGVSDPPTVLKSRYNPAWEHVRIGDILRVIVDHIANQHLSADEMD